MTDNDTNDDIDPASIQEDREMITNLGVLARYRDKETPEYRQMFFAEPVALLEIIGAICRELVRLGCDVNELRDSETVTELVHHQFGALAGGILGWKRRDGEDEVTARLADVDVDAVTRLSDHLWTAGRNLRAVVYGTSSLAG